MSRYMCGFRGLVAVAVLVLFCVPVMAADRAGASEPTGNDAASAGVPNHRTVNLHLSVGGAFAVGDELGQIGLGKNGGQGTLGLDLVLTGPIAFSILGGFNGYAPGDTGALRDLFVGMGFRARFLVDRSGSLGEDGGNPFGNIWLDAHLSYHIYESENHGGFNIGVGYEFSLAKNFNLGPYGRFQYTPWGGDLNYMMLSVGLQVSLGAQTEDDDLDRDGIEDKKDGCKDQAEDKDGFEDEDGCPDLDNDGDSVPDRDDECPDMAGVPDKAGCPDDDNDRDGIKNESDKCSDKAEDMDGFEDADGCPDLDNDKDGVQDDADGCKDEAEDKDGFEDGDGCPDLDNDKDGIPDTKDKCPSEPESQNGKDDEDGCMDFIRMGKGEIELLSPIEFAEQADKILDKSYPVLDEIALALNLKTQLRVRIEGHTDNRGNEKNKLDLSQRRAKSTVKYLVEKGVGEARLSAEGFGGAKPVQDNATKEGRNQNNRIEFHIVE